MMHERTCKKCKARFEAARRDAKFCCDGCRKAASRDHQHIEKIAKEAYNNVGILTSLMAVDKENEQAIHNWLIEIRRLANDPLV